MNNSKHKTDIHGNMKNEASGSSFIRFPRAMISNPLFFNVSIEARTLLALILDRHSLSTVNAERFTDEDGKVFIIYTVEEVCSIFGCGNEKALRMFRELESENMIIRKRKSRSLPYRIYIAPWFSEFLKQEFADTENRISRSRNSETREFGKPEDSNIENSNIENSKTYQSFIGFERTEEEIKEQIEYDCLVCDANRNLLDEIVMIISDVLNGTSPTLRIDSDDKPRGLVISRFCKLDSEHILYVFSQIKSNTSNIRNVKAYLMTLLYNAPATMHSETEATFAYNSHKIS